MHFRPFSLSRRSLTTAVALVGLVSLGLGAHAAFIKRPTGPKATDSLLQDVAAEKPSRLALVIGNGHYPDAGAPLSQSINDARALTGALRKQGFEVDVVEDASHEDMTQAVDRLAARVRPDSVVMLFFGGYGIQAGHESFMIPVDAAIWKESDVRRNGVSVQSVLDVVKDRGAKARLAVIDASRRNPYERRFRSYSHGLASIHGSDNALVLSSAAPGRVADDAAGQHGVLAAELLQSFSEPVSDVEDVFRKARVAVTVASRGAQIPAVTSTLREDVSFAPPKAAVTAKAGG